MGEQVDVNAVCRDLAPLWCDQTLRSLQQKLDANGRDNPHNKGSIVLPVPTGCKECAFTGKITLLTSIVPCDCQENQRERST